MQGGIAGIGALSDRVQEQNLTRQYGLLTNSIEIGLTKGSGAFASRRYREGYYTALRKADRAWEDGHLDVTAMEAYLAPLVQAQLENQDRMPNPT